MEKGIPHSFRLSEAEERLLAKLVKLRGAKSESAYLREQIALQAELLLGETLDSAVAQKQLEFVPRLSSWRPLERMILNFVRAERAVGADVPSWAAALEHRDGVPTFKSRNEALEQAIIAACIEPLSRHEIYVHEEVKRAAAGGDIDAAIESCCERSMLVALSGSFIQQTRVCIAIGYFMQAKQSELARAPTTLTESSGNNDGMVDVWPLKATISDEATTRALSERIVKFLDGTDGACLEAICSELGCSEVDAERATSDMYLAGILDEAGGNYSIATRRNLGSDDATTEPAGITTELAYPSDNSVVEPKQKKKAKANTKRHEDEKKPTKPARNQKALVGLVPRTEGARKPLKGAA